MLNSNLSEQLQGVLSSGARTSRSLNHFDEKAIQQLPTSGTATIKAEGVRFERNANGTVSVLYDVIGNDSVKTLNKSHLFGRHYTEGAGNFKMADILCRTSGLTDSMGRIDQVEFTEDDRKQTINVWVPIRDITVTFSAKAKVYVANGRDAWNKSTSTMDMSKEKENYPVLTLS